MIYVEIEGQKVEVDEVVMKKYRLKVGGRLPFSGLVIREQKEVKNDSIGDYEGVKQEVGK